MADPIKFPDEPFYKVIEQIGRVPVGEPKHKTPYISVAKLGEYLTLASANRRKTIVRDMKYGDPPKMTRYRDAYGPMVESLMSGSMEPVHQMIDNLKSRTGGSDYAKQDRNLTRTALKRFGEVFPNLDLQKYKIIDRHNHSGKVSLFGVDVSVRPEGVLEFRDRSGNRVGGIKLIISKTKPLTEQWAEYIGAAMHQYLDDAYSAEPAQSSCIVIDVFAKKVFTAPRAFKKRREDIAGACQEIALWWDSL